MATTGLQLAPTASPHAKCWFCPLLGTCKLGEMAIRRLFQWVWRKITFLVSFGNCLYTMLGWEVLVNDF